MSTKYECTGETRSHFGRTVRRIRALVDIPSKAVTAGDLGGWIEYARNLSDEGSCWVADNAIVCDEAEVRGSATVSGSAVVTGYSKVTDHALIYGHAYVNGHTKVSGNACIGGSATATGYSSVSDNAIVGEHATLRGFAVVKDYARVFGSADVGEKAIIYGHAKVEGSAKVLGSAKIGFYMHMKDREMIYDGTLEMPPALISVGPVGSRSDTVTLNIVTGSIATGCFRGDLDEFVKQIEKTHANHQQHRMQYTAVADMFRAVLKCYDDSTDDQNQEEEHNE